MRCASTLLVPCAMLANGPQWTIAGAPSAVCTRLGRSASFSSTIIGPTAFRSAAVTGLAVVVEADDDAAEAPAQIGAALGQRQDRHDLGRGGDDEPGLARRAVVAAAHAGGDRRSARSFMSMRAARGSRWGRCRRSLPKCRCASSSAASRLCADGDGVEVAGEVQVDLVERRERRLAAAGGAALLPKTGPSDGSRSAGDGVCAELDQSLRQADGGDRLAFAARRRRDGGDEDQLSAARGKTIERFEPDLGGVAAVGLEQVVGEAEACGDVGDGLHDSAEMIPRARARGPPSGTVPLPAGVHRGCHVVAADVAVPTPSAARGLRVLRRRRQPAADHPAVGGLPHRLAAADRDARRVRSSTTG